MRRFNELLDRYGMDTVLTATGQLTDYTERVLRQRIAEIPDGEYGAEGFFDDDGRNSDVRLPIKVCVRVKGDGIEIDLTGSADQIACRIGDILGRGRAVSIVRGPEHLHLKAGCGAGRRVAGAHRRRGRARLPAGSQNLDFDDAEATEVGTYALVPCDAVLPGE